MLALRKNEEVAVATLTAGSLWLGLLLSRGILTTNDSPSYYSGFLDFSNVGGMRGYILPALYGCMPSELFLGIFNFALFSTALGFLCRRLRTELSTDRWIIVFLIVSPALTLNSLQWSAYVMAHSAAISLGLIALALTLSAASDEGLKGSAALFGLVLITTRRT